MDLHTQFHYHLRLASETFDLAVQAARADVIVESRGDQLDEDNSGQVVSELLISSGAAAVPHTITEAMAQSNITSISALRSSISELRSGDDLLTQAEDMHRGLNHGSNADFRTNSKQSSEGCASKGIFEHLQWGCSRNSERQHQIWSAADLGLISLEVDEHFPPADLNLAVPGEQELAPESIESHSLNCPNFSNPRNVLSNWAKLFQEVEKLWTESVTVLHPSWQIGASNNKEDESWKNLARGMGTLAAVNQYASEATITSGAFLETCEQEIQKFRIKVFRKEWQVLHPCCWQRLIWDIITMAICAYDFAMFPLHIVELTPKGVFQTTIDGIAISVWIFDIFLSFGTGYFAKDGTVELHFGKVCRRYLKSYFVFDITLITLDGATIYIAAQKHDALRLAKATRFLRGVRLIRILRVSPRLSDRFGAIGFINSDYMHTGTTVLQYIMVIIFFNHYIACAVYGTWDYWSTEITDQPLGVYEYMTGLHWALSHSVLGSMDLTPRNTYARIFVCIMLLLSLVLFSALIGSITNSTSVLRESQGRKLKLECMVRHFFADNNISRELAGLVWKFVWMHAEATKHRMRITEIPELANLPFNLHAQIKCESFLPVLRRHPMFDRFSRLERASMGSICNSLEQSLARAHEEFAWVVHGVATRMAFIISGGMVYQPSWDLSLDIKVGAGGWVCEEVLWARHALLSGTLCASESGADVLLLDPKEFQDHARVVKHKKSLLMLANYAQHFVDNFNAASEDESNTDLLFNDLDHIGNILYEVDPSAKDQSRSSKYSLMSSDSGIWM